MRLVTCEHEGMRLFGAVVDGHVVDLARVLRGQHADMMAFLAAGELAVDAAHAYLEAVQRQWNPDRHPALDEVRLLAPVPRPGKIVGIGRNYADHAAETGSKPFEKPRLFLKAPSSVVGPGSAVPRPDGVTKLDYEIELAVVIGHRTRLVVREHALEAVAGYTILNDVSAREYQFDIAPPQTSFAKSMDAFCPMGPWLVTRDEIPDPQALSLDLYVNGERLQHGSTRDMVFDVATLIEYITRFMTLEPGDVIATGTPAGVGAFRQPPRWLQPGDQLELAISGIGELRHTIA